MKIAISQQALDILNGVDNDAAETTQPETQQQGIRTMQRIINSDGPQLVVAAQSFTHSPRVSEHYNHLHTEDVIAALAKTGYRVTSSSQVVPRKIATEHATHLVRLRHERFFDSGDEMFPEIVIKNGHAGKTALQLMSGIFRCVCSNGLIAGEIDSIIRLPHNRNTTMDAVFDGARWIVEKAERSIQKANAWKRVSLTPEAQMQFAKMISDYVRGERAPIEAGQLFKDRYDEPRNLWTLFNNAQETLMTGDYVSETGRKQRTISDVNKTVELNRALWSIAEGFAH